MYITQEKYLEAANRNLKEWFIDNKYDIIFIPLVARDYLTAYLLNFTNLNYSAPELDYVLTKLNNYNKEIVEKFSVLNIKFSEGVKDLDYYLPILFELKDYVNNELNILNRKQFKWIKEYSEFMINNKIYNFKEDYPDKLSNIEKQLFDAINPGLIKTYKNKENLLW